MTTEAAVRMLAGGMIVLSLTLAHLFSAHWYLLTWFVGLNLLQSAFTHWCPAITVFRRLGLKDQA
jgi:hypothetical protein